MPEGKEQDTFQRELTRGEIEQLIAAGIVDENQREAVLAEHRKSIDWKSWLSLWTSTVGAVFLLAGVVFFFAWNWKELSPFARFAVLESGVVAATIGALIVGVRRQAGQWLLVAASVFTGVLVAVYGQVYQTGADAFEVFALWAALIFGWVLISRFAPLWWLWFSVLQIAVATYFGQVQVASGLVTWTAMYLVLGMLSAVLVILWEWLQSSDRFSWLRGEWIRVGLVASVLIWLSAIPWDTIFDFRWRNYEAPTSRGIGLLAWVLAVVERSRFAAPFLGSYS